MSSQLWHCPSSITLLNLISLSKLEKLLIINTVVVRMRRNNFLLLILQKLVHGIFSRNISYSDSTSVILFLTWSRECIGMAVARLCSVEGTLIVKGEGQHGIYLVSPALVAVVAFWPERHPAVTFCAWRVLSEWGVSDMDRRMWYIARETVMLFINGGMLLTHLRVEGRNLCSLKSSWEKISKG